MGLWEWILQIILLVAGFAFLVKGADFFVDGAAAIAKKLGVPQLVIGLTIVAMGTSLPETAVSLTSSFSDKSGGICVGNIVGSNIFNILIILGITAVITSVKVEKTTVRYEMPFVIGITALLLLFGFTGNTISWWECIIFWALFIAYLIYLFVGTKKGFIESDDEGEIKDIKVWLAIIMIIAGAAMIVIGSNFVVNSATKIAQALGVTERVIGLTVAALGTSLPELVTSVTAAVKKNAGICIGNIVGSNIFNILFVLGTTSLITASVPFESTFIIDTLVAIGAALLLWVSVLKRKMLVRGWGIVMLVCYAGYFVYLCL